MAGTFVSGYGTGEDIVNYGVDWTCSEGITVVAARAGKVTRAGWYGGYGYCVDIQHEDGSLTRYANNSRLTVSVGEQVSQGQQIALSGSTGDVTSPRLHFEIWIDGTRLILLIMLIRTRIKRTKGVDIFHTFLNHNKMRIRQIDIMIWCDIIIRILKYLNICLNIFKDNDRVIP